LINYNAKKSKTSVEGNCAHILVFQQSSIHIYHWDFVMKCFYFHYCQLDKLQYFFYMLFFCQSSIRDSKRKDHNIHKRCFLLTNFWFLHFNCLKDGKTFGNVSLISSCITLIDTMVLSSISLYPSFYLAVTTLFPFI
jgi:hypothetical protein